MGVKFCRSYYLGHIMVIELCSSQYLGHIVWVTLLVLNVETLFESHCVGQFMWVSNFLSICLSVYTVYVICVPVLTNMIIYDMHGSKVHGSRSQR